MPLSSCHTCLPSLNYRSFFSSNHHFPFIFSKADRIPDYIHIAYLIKSPMVIIHLKTFKIRSRLSASRRYFCFGEVTVIVVGCLFAIFVFFCKKMRLPKHWLLLAFSYALLTLFVVVGNDEYGLVNSVKVSVSFVQRVVFRNGLNISLSFTLDLEILQLHSTL